MLESDLEFINNMISSDILWLKIWLLVKLVINL